MMPGMIMLWYGSVATIPSGWALCNGANNTPDLRNKFVLGAKDAGPGPAPGDTGGANSHSHPFTGDGHAHDLLAGNEIDEVVPTGEWLHQTSIVPATGTTDTSVHTPPYHGLCYIMKLPIP